MDIKKAFGLLMRQEGIELTDTAGDKGGLTKYGIAKASHPNVDIVNLTPERAEAIYETEYWNAGHCSELKPELQYIHFSSCVNFGVIGAIKILQRACNVKVDGVIGPATLGASQSITIQNYAVCCVERYREIVEADENQQIFMKGWLKRIDDILGWYKAGELI